MFATSGELPILGFEYPYIGKHLQMIVNLDGLDMRMLPFGLSFRQYVTALVYSSIEPVTGYQPEEVK